LQAEIAGGFAWEFPRELFRTGGPGALRRDDGIRYHSHFFIPHITKRTLMATVSTNEMKAGTKVLIDGEPYAIVDNEYRKPGKGQATNTLKIRNLKNGRVIERTLKSGDSWELADVETLEMQYLYNDGEFWTFMDPKSFEQIQAGGAAMEEAKQWLKGEETCNVLLWNGVPLSVAAPNSVLLQITETDPGLRGDTSGGGGKPATLETGAVVRVPLFVQQGEVIKVDTRTGEYLGRVGK
jgi:elongation factor P